MLCVVILQEEYYATHQCFLTNRSLFLLVWNVMDGEAGLLSLRPWLENIEVCILHRSMFAMNLRKICTLIDVHVHVFCEHVYVYI